MVGAASAGGWRLAVEAIEGIKKGCDCSTPYLFYLANFDEYHALFICPNK